MQFTLKLQMIEFQPGKDESDQVLNIMLVMLGSLLLGGCGWSLLMSAEERAAAAFQSGTDAYESGEFSQAIGFFRQVLPSQHFTIKRFR